ncbi:MAG: hypothetical protein MUC62_01990 [Candidatus Thermoplasmatota archaeon]|nr:hypothetical protein [Candidatus Thermoplasmatota archaeon]
MDQMELLFQISSKVLRDATALKLNGRTDGGEGSDLRVPGSTPQDNILESSIIELVRERSTGWGVISEEGLLEKGDGTTVLYMDPLDGSYNAVNQIPFFSTSLALFDVGSEEVTHAMVIEIPTGRIYHSMLGSGTYMDNIRLHTRDRDLKDAALSVYIGSESITQIEGIVNGVRRIRYLGCDSLEMCSVAQGSLDGTLYFGRIPRKTDIAASMLIVRESGGEVFSVLKEGGSKTCRLGDPWGDLKGIVSLGRPANIQMLLPLYCGLSQGINAGDDST